MSKYVKYSLVLALLLLGAGLIYAQMPAARIGDMHTCPMVTGLVPHVGGPIITGSGNVVICGMPAAFLTSQAVCVGPPDQIVYGSPTVIINGRPAARLGDASAHGGVVVQGCYTVLIGG
jgi:uncharacterized Zn-binding protein involved in type VI secretion